MSNVNGNGLPIFANLGNVFTNGLRVSGTPVLFPASSIDPLCIANFSSLGVDLSTNQTIGGVKTFLSNLVLSSYTTYSTLVIDQYHSIVSVQGVAGTVLTSNGYSALPSYQPTVSGAITLQGDSGSNTGTTFKVSGGTSGLSTSITGSELDIGGTLAIANGGTGSSTQNFVDLTSAQTVAGVKSFSSQPVAPSIKLTTGAASGKILQSDSSGNSSWVTAPSAISTLWGDSGSATGSTVLFQAGLTGLNFIASGSSVQLTGILNTSHGGTGSSSQNFVDLSTNQTVAGIKSFSSQPAAPSIQLTTGASSGLFLQSDSSGNSSWATVPAGGITTINANSGNVTGSTVSIKGGTTGLTTSTTGTEIDLTGTLAIANGGTGSTSQNFVDLTTNQTVAGNKSLSGITSLVATTQPIQTPTFSSNNITISYIANSVAMASNNSVNFTVYLTNIPTTLNSVNVVTLVLDATTYKSLGTTCYVNGTLATLQFVNGVTNATLNASVASTIIQQFIIFYNGSGLWLVTSALSGAF